ncbi:TMV resistance protein N-like isoform X1 [Vigna unguiculata]|uniref:TMV resistance protein N-like isoform X1 n=2 Tax=Vigna unguiculata TaxID=3917 RepID=UPI001016D49D|nr:TMV resistance protein N-like isoform X1 [Vigna unguiculata]
MAVPSFSFSFTYDVFLSFRGEDTRYGFTGNLYRALRDRGIHTFIDDEELRKGDEITSALEKAIEGSRIFIIVFSLNYASSSFCLNELAYILPHAKRNALLVLPLFYDVVPSHVRHHTGSFGEALDAHEKRFRGMSQGFELNIEKLNKWKMALRRAANLSGYHFKHGEEYEYQFIERIVELVSKKINRAPLHVGDYPVGLEARVLEVKLLLEVGSDDVVHLVGIHGLGGIGKTTLALALYNSIADHFEGLCFLENVRENSNKHGLHHLQRILLSQVLGENNINITSVRQGISMMQHRLRQKKILLILDDVDKHEQLQAIVGRPDWFGPGSRVIITTRDKQLLSCHLVEKLYKVKKLEKNNALRLLSWKGFRTEEVDTSYLNVMDRVLAYASGHPLALEVIGSKLFSKSVKEWESAIKQYEKIPSNQILEVLKVSFDALEEVEKSVFLDIACCFKGYALSEIEDILRAHYGDCMKYHIGVLVEKSLMKYGYNSVVTLHDLIEDMGKEIVREKSPKNPGKRSRLWSPEDIIQVLEDNSGSGEIEIICLNSSLPDKEEIVGWNRKAFKKMKNLKTLIIKKGKFSEGPKYLPNSLRVLEWLKYPSQGLPPDFRSKKLAICKLPSSSFGSLELAEFSKKFMNMTLLNFDECEGLTHIPDVSGLPNLEKVSFKNCKSLVTIHDSFGFLGKLNSLSAVGCSKLRSFPPLKLTSLENLELSYCHSLESFPEILEKMGKITELVLEDCHIKELPFSFHNLTELQTLQLRWCPILRLPSSIVMMPKLAQIIAWESKGWLFPKQVDGEEKGSSMVSSNVDCLVLSGCKLSDDFFPVIPEWFSNVKDLDLSRNNFTVLPECISNCHSLCKLTLDSCHSLQEIRGIPPNIRHLSARNCKSFTSSCRSTLLNQKLHEAGNTMFWLSGAKFPEWFDHHGRGPSCSFWVGNKFPSIALCIAIGQTHIEQVEIVGPIMIINGIECSFDEEEDPYLYMLPHHTHIFDLQHIVFSDYLDRYVSENEWNHVEITYSVEQRFNKKDKHAVTPISIENGIYVLKQRSSMEDIQFTDPHKKRRLDVV